MTLNEKFEALLRDRGEIIDARKKDSPHYQFGLKAFLAGAKAEREEVLDSVVTERSEHVHDDILNCGWCAALDEIERQIKGRDNGRDDR